jgi:hypothetical protein
LIICTIRNTRVAYKVPLSPSRAEEAFDQHVLASRAIDSTLADNQRGAKTNAGPIEYDQRSRLSRFDEEEDAVDEQDRGCGESLSLDLEAPR